MMVGPHGVLLLQSGHREDSIMIKVIKQGTRKKVNCSECGSGLSYEAEG